MNRAIQKIARVWRKSQTKHLRLKGNQGVEVHLSVDELVPLTLHAYDGRAKIEISGPSRRVKSS